jgi:hypothetical protein
MRQIARTWLLLTLAFVVAAPLSAAETRKKAPEKFSLATSVLKKLEKAGLTDEQVAKIKELAAKVEEKTAAPRQKAMSTPEQNKARAEAIKKAKAEGKEGKELVAAVNAAVKLTPAQEAARREVQKAYSDMMKQIVGMLTDEQKAKLPRKSRSKKAG